MLPANRSAALQLRQAQAAVRQETTDPGVYREAAE